LGAVAIRGDAHLAGSYVLAMVDFLLKQLLFILEPIGLVWAGLGVLAVCLWRHRQKRFAIAAAGIFLFMTIIGSTPLPGWMLESLEKPYAGVRIEDLPSADAIVMLGGGSEPARYEAFHVHLSPAADRLLMARTLLRMGKSTALMLGGGGAKLDGRARMEADGVRDVFAAWDVPLESMISLGFNRDTHDEALHARAVANRRGWNRILLVTSANHMRRAAAVFRRQGFEVIPAPCNFLTSLSTAPGDSPAFISVPRHDGFVKASIWLHEQAGWWIYRARGWI
jgi:uncharacterized SAM-binding protein YcdF (DUF218 family)